MKIINSSIPIHWNLDGIYCLVGSLLQLDGVMIHKTVASSFVESESEEGSETETIEA